MITKKKGSRTGVGMERAVEMEMEKSVTQKLGTARASPGGTKAKGSPADGSHLLPFFGYGGGADRWPGRQKNGKNHSLFFLLGSRRIFWPTHHHGNQTERRQEWKIIPDTHTLTHKPRPSVSLALEKHQRWPSRDLLLRLLKCTRETYVLANTHTTHT